MVELKACPFCGGEAELRAQNVYTSNAWLVHCKKCHCRTVIQPVGLSMVYYGQRNIDVTEEMAKQKSIELWNLRDEPEARELTLDELRGMDGEPVWFYDDAYKSGRWAIMKLSPAYPGCIWLDSLKCLREENIGNRWHAYTRKPKGEV